MTAKSSPAIKDMQPISELSFEVALAELEQIVRALESGSAELDKAISDYARGTALKDHCMKKLDAAKLHVEKLTIDANGVAKLSPLD